MAFVEQAMIGPLPLGPARRYSGEIVVGKDKQTDALEVLKEFGSRIVPFLRSDTDEKPGPVVYDGLSFSLRRGLLGLLKIHWEPDPAFEAQAASLRR